MPTTRKSASAARGPVVPTKGQSTISFSTRVTKPIPKDVKGAVENRTVAKVVFPEKETAPTTDDVVSVIPEEPKVVVEPKAVVEPEEVEDEEDEEDEVEEKAEEEQIPERSEVELRAEKMTDAQISQYWKAIEKQRLAPRVHQEGLDLSEKVLRYFDVSSQYGPCIGITRMRRWNRAKRLGLNPPIEVLAVLLKEEALEEKDSAELETAQIDRILNPVASAA